MRLEWFEDLAALYGSASLTEAAAQRHVSQPAFSRRIQMLEQWLGIDLIDRTRKPVTLTAAAREQEASLRALVGTIYEFRSSARARSMSERVIMIGAQHSLSVQPLLEWLRAHDAGEPRLVFRLMTGNREECVSSFVRGELDILYCYGDPSAPPMLPPALAQTFRCGSDELIPVAAPALLDAHASSPSLPLSLLVYPRESFFGDLLWAQKLNDIMSGMECQIVCVTSFALGMMDLAVAGAGFAWLPRRLVESRLASGLLVEAPLLGGPITLDIMASCRGNARWPKLPDLLDSLTIR